MLPEVLGVSGIEGPRGTSVLERVRPTLNVEPRAARLVGASVPGNLSAPRGTRIRPELPNVGSAVAMGPQLIVAGPAAPGRRRLSASLLDRAVESGGPVTLQSPARSWGV